MLCYDSKVCILVTMFVKDKKLDDVFLRPKMFYIMMKYKHNKRYKKKLLSNYPFDICLMAVIVHLELGLCCSL